MRAEQKIVEGEGEESERLGPKAFEGRVRGTGRRVESDDGIQKSSFVTT